MKNIKLAILICFSTLMLFLQSCGREYSVGDIYSDGDVKGVVLRVDDSNSPLLLLSLDEISGIDADSANVWASSLGDGEWRLADRQEMEIVRKYRALINNTFERKSYPKVLEGNTYYWTSTPCSESHVYACGPDGVRCYFKSNNTKLYRARAVRVL